MFIGVDVMEVAWGWIIWGEEVMNVAVDYWNFTCLHDVLLIEL